MLFPGKTVFRPYGSETISSFVYRRSIGGPAVVSITRNVNATVSRGPSERATGNTAVDAWNRLIRFVKNYRRRR